MFKREDGLAGSELQLACGQCIGCRLEYSRQWAVRMYHEAQLHDENSFITLTYDDDHLPFGNTLLRDELSRFMKRLRYYTGANLRYYGVGEYGEETYRPHYHACLFGWAFPDREHWRTEKGYKYYRSPTLERAWKLGNSELTDFTFDTAAYCARYITKKITGDDAQQHYERVDLDTGEIVEVLPEYARMSLNPAIAKEWWEKFGKSVVDWDSVVIDGKELPPPRYYDVLSDESELQTRKLRRIRKAKASPDNTPERLAVREECKRQKLIHRLKRSYL